MYLEKRSKYFKHSFINYVNFKVTNLSSNSIIQVI